MMLPLDGTKFIQCLVWFHVPFCYEKIGSQQTSCVSSNQQITLDSSMLTPDFFDVKWPPPELDWTWI